MTCLRLVLGDQLNPAHPWLARHDPEVVYVLMEIRQETDYVRHHAQKVLAIFAAMRRFAANLENAGHRVDYLAISDPANTQSLPGNLDLLQRRYRATRIEYQEPDEWRLDRQLADYAQQQAIAVQMCSSAHFFAARDAVGQFFSSRTQWRMEYFYRDMRCRHGILLAPDGKPCGGAWNFDHDNRASWKGAPAAPADLRPQQDLRALWQEIVSAGVQTFGDPQAAACRWPLDRGEALAQLAQFIAHILPHFGHYQDAMSRHEPRLFHSLLSFALNIKLLSPAEVVAAAEAAYRHGAVPLPAAEGFIRQILGWREYVRGVYWARMPEYARHNVLQHERALPRWYWTGETRMACLGQSIRDSLAHAYAHHIQRLMLTGNFALLAGIAPQQVHEWYLGIYSDAFEWVELPNTLGMSQFADGGLLASKPYAGSAAYISRMGDYCQGCHYRSKQRTGERACPFNSLYWDFFARHAERLQGNPRLGPVYRNLARFTPEELAALRAQAASYLQRLDEL
ncbi:cryptochrome/photolyase family protein [Chitinilyticum litopenaei]|uniref:cryptochrome/photolyase family protein n=1 Tax=Chitinilyticum litopenaei TaxID=1121276 RepID=UPI0004097035|nr:cryptochrome/photolyase family protein [Chitinilyticum litopenaei]